MTLQLGTNDQSLPGGVYNLPVTAYSHQQYAKQTSEIDNISEVSEIESESEIEQANSEIVTKKLKVDKKNQGAKTTS